MAKIAKGPRRAFKRVTLAGRQAILDHSPEWARRYFGPVANYLDMLFVDHGVFRLAYVNQHKLGAQAWRSAQPAPHQIGQIARLGVKTIVNLRGERLCGSFWLEQEACRRHGIELVNFQIRSRAAPTPQEIHDARRLFERIQYPMLMHCKSGADRAGLMSVLYRFLKEGRPLEEAMQELSLKYGHIRQADTGVLDYFFERYLDAKARTGIEFFDWLDTVYDPDELKRSFQARGWANGIVNGMLRRE